MKNLKCQLTFVVLLLLTLSFNTYQTVVAATNDVSEYYGQYELQEEDSIIDRIIISEDMFSIILNNEIAPADYVDKHHMQKYLDIINRGNLTELSLKDEYEYVKLDFYKDYGVPTFRIDVMNPVYSNNSTSLFVRHNEFVIWNFNTETTGQLVDEKQFVFTLME
ncbi:hypothetical protein ACTQ54_04875 [Fundicoccus sp. Sow4_H7]|uniref:hypothetical protein n=1 Tax=Fundicoccus sp. Sow4_H7 TaxID=3438784 RepID=UPI003F93638C